MDFYQFKTLERSFLHLLRRAHSPRELIVTLQVIGDELGRKVPPEDQWFEEALRTICSEHDLYPQPPDAEDALWATMLFAAHYYMQLKERG